MYREKKLSDLLGDQVSRLNEMFENQHDCIRDIHFDLLGLVDEVEQFQFDEIDFRVKETVKKQDQLEVELRQKHNVNKDIANCAILIQIEKETVEALLRIPISATDKKLAKKQKKEQEKGFLAGLTNIRVIKAKMQNLNVDSSGKEKVSILMYTVRMIEARLKSKISKEGDIEKTEAKKKMDAKGGKDSGNPTDSKGLKKEEGGKDSGKEGEPGTSDEEIAENQQAFDALVKALEEAAKQQEADALKEAEEAKKATSKEKAKAKAAGGKAASKDKVGGKDEGEDSNEKKPLSKEVMRKLKAWGGQEKDFQAKLDREKARLKKKEDLIAKNYIIRVSNKKKKEFTGVYAGKYEIFKSMPSLWAEKIRKTEEGVKLAEVLLEVRRIIIKSKS
jgi:hypothetical protein